MAHVQIPRYFHRAVAAVCRQGRFAPGAGTGTTRRGLSKVLTGLGLCILVLLLGLLAKTGPVARLDLRAEQRIASDRTVLLTDLARAATTTATPETFGIGLMIVIPVILMLARRRLDALKVLCMFAGAFALAEIGKVLVSERRPPAALEAMRADSAASYPSGHVTTAAVLAAALIVVAVTRAARCAAIILGVLYTATVAASRVYLAVHYPPDVLGGILCALAAAFIVVGLTALPGTQRRLRRFGVYNRRDHRMNRST